MKLCAGAAFGILPFLFPKEPVPALPYSPNGRDHLFQDFAQTVPEATLVAGLSLSKPAPGQCGSRESLEQALILPSAVAVPKLVREQLPPRRPARQMRIRHVHVAGALAPVHDRASKGARARRLELRRADHVQYSVRKSRMV